MPVVPYCVVDASTPAVPSMTGVANAPVCILGTHGLLAFYSAVPALSTDPAGMKADALSFHAVITVIFKHSAVIQFRFPTLLDNAHALEKHVQQYADEYLDFLRRVRELVQMEIRISGPPSAQAQNESGREYLLSKQAASRVKERYCSELQSAAAELLSEWKVRRSHAGLRCYALVSRADVERFRQRIQAVLSSMPDAQAVLSGPWPVTEFLDVTLKV